MAELIGCRECDSPSCKGCNIKILADMLNRGKLNALMNKNRRIDDSVDAAPVVHGEWIEGEDEYTSFLKCSVCGEEFCSWDGDCARTNYCPNCGADMRGGHIE